LTFSKGFAWVLKENGKVHQYPITVKIENDTDKICDVTVASKPRVIDELENVMQICTGNDHFIALNKAGDVFAMGDDTLGQCGVGAQKRSPAPPYFESRVRKPLKINDISSIKKVACGGNHTLALHNDGMVYGWGSNSAVQLSHEQDFASVKSPLLAAFTPVRIEKELGSVVGTDIAAGDEFSIIVGRNKHNNETEVFGCGLNLHGEI
jgi:alpha-tubulin suppressor-like RCC1 family protein